MINNDELYTVKDVSKILKVDVHKVYNLIYIYNI